jgi:hypothetical protein
MRQLCPLRPLTEAGRVLVCTAASLFAALLLVAWTAVPPDDIEPARPLTSADAAR